MKIRKYFEQLMEKVDLLNTKTSDFDPKLIKNGAKVEKEHTTDIKKAEKVAKQHAAEFPKVKNKKIGSDYYKELDKMENKLKKHVTKSFKDVVDELKEDACAGGAGSVFGAGSTSTATQFSGDNYAKGDNRNLFGSGAKKKKRSKKPLVQKRTLNRSL